jgi:polysaccharide biosynthesis protein PslJ
MVVHPAASPRGFDLKRPSDAATVLIVYVILLVALPAQLVFKPLGAVGTPAMLVGLLSLLWWANAGLVPGLRLQTRFQPVRIAVLLLVATVLASYANAALRPEDPLLVRSADRGLIAIAGWSGVALLAADGILTRERLDAVLRCLVLATGFLASLGIAQFFTGFDLGPIFQQIPGLQPNTSLTFVLQRSAFHRVSGTALHPIEFGVILAMVLPLAAHYAMRARPGRRLLHWGVVVLIGLGIPLSVSRSAFLGVAAAGVMLMISWSWRQRAATLAIAGGFLVLFSAAVPHLLGSIYNLTINAGTDPSITHRTNDYSLVGTFISQQPIFGQGFNTFVPSRFFLLDNQYLGALIEIGIVGTLVLIVFILTALFTARGARLRSQDEVTRELAQALASSAAVALVTFAAFDALGFFMVTGIMFLIFGCCGALWRLVQEPQAAREALPRPTGTMVPSSAPI